VIQYDYHLAYDDGNMVIRDSDETLIERYDKKSKQWVEDLEMSRIYFGSIPVKRITEKEAMKIISSY
jgi:hypothetical protein